jgi:UDP-arabinose 4-epimerase
VRVLVAGGAGYIGSHTCKALAEAGHMPIVCDNFHTGHIWAVKWGPLERGDLNDAAALAAAFRRHRPDAVINFAALAYVGESNAEPTRYYRSNMGGMIALLEAMRAHDIGAMIFSSSCATYGEPPHLPIVESMRQDPINPYDRSKRMGEEVLRDACAAHGLAAIALRYFNAAGADVDGEIGEEHDPETHLIPLALQAAAGARPRISIFGTDYETPDGSCIRDYVHVSDLASAHVAALSACRSGQFGAYNLGAGQGVSINEVFAQAHRITGRRTTASPEGQCAGDPPVLVADASLARTALKWRPAYSNLDNVIETAWRWLTEYRDRAMAAKGG